MKSYVLLGLSLAGASFAYSQTPAPAAPAAAAAATITLTGPQNAAVNAMNTLLQSHAAAVTSARAALTQASFGGGGSAAIRTQVDALVAAEHALATARANALALIQGSANKLSAQQLQMVATSSVTPPAGGGGGGGGGGALNSPEVNAAEKTFTVRYRAPNASQVVVIGEIDGKPEHPMTKDANGIWSVTIGPLRPDVYNYQIRADGIVAMDPANPNIKIGFGGFPPANLVEIPGPETAFQDTRDVPHGSIRVETYHSKVFGGAPRTMWVYTPPGYETGNQRYPVFYLLNGSGNTDSSWILTGRANTILDNLIAEGKAKPMIIVSPMGYARTGIGTGPDQNLTAAANASGTGFWYAREFLQDIIPYVDGKFRTLTDADNRAIGGLSMGGGHSMQIGFPNTDVFHSIVVMSAGAGANVDQTYPTFFGDAEATNKKMKLVWVGSGGLDLNGARALDAALTAKGIKHAPLWVMEGERHEWVVWRHALRDVAPQLFR